MNSRITFLFAAALATTVAVSVTRAEDKAAPPAAPPAAAGGAPATAPGTKAQAWQKPCDADIQKLCKGVAGGAVPECLAKNEKALSEECTNAFLWRYKVTQICKEDIDKLCKAKIEAHTTTLGQCFKENEANLSEKCKAALVKGSKQQKAEVRSDKGAAQPADKAAEKSSDKPAHHGGKHH